MKFFTLLLFLFTTITAQYSVNDYELVKTTYTKSFNREIIEKYLNSDNPTKVIAGILSTAQSKDTTFIQLIIKKDFETFGKYISFAIGQIGYSNLAINFLSKKLFESGNEKYSTDILEACGKIGTVKHYEKLLSWLQSKKHGQIAGISYALYNFNQRGIIKDVSPLPELLLNELDKDNEQKTFDALFGLARITLDSLSSQRLSEFLIKNHKNLSVRNICYALTSLRRVAVSPLDFNTLEMFFSDVDWRIRTEAIRLLPKLKLNKKSELEKYFSLIEDDNPNVSRTACSTLSNLNIKNNLKEFLKDKTKGLLGSPGLSKNAKSDLLISYASLFPEENSSIVSKLEQQHDVDVLPAIISLKNFEADTALQYLRPLLKNKKLSVRMNALEALLNYQQELENNNDYKKIILHELSNNESSIISLTCFSVDSVFIADNSNVIKKVITNQCKNKLNDYYFTEALTSLHYLASKIDSVFADSTLEYFRLSNVDDLVRYYKANRNEQKVLRSDENFEKFWDNAFKYSTADVRTTEGLFTMKFLAGIAPISVGNFCYLASQNYFDDVVFHRVVPDFVAQVGDPTGTGWGGPGYTINSELSPTDVAVSLVGMASSGPDTEG